MANLGLMALLTGAGAGYQQGQSARAQQDAARAAAAQAYALKQQQMQQQAAYQQGLLSNAATGIDAANTRAANDLAEKGREYDITNTRLSAPPVPKPLTPLDFAKMRNDAIATAGNLPTAEQVPYLKGQNSILSGAGVAPLALPGEQIGSRPLNYGLDPSQLNALAVVRKIVAGTTDPNATVDFNGQKYSRSQFSSKFAPGTAPINAPYYQPDAPTQSKITHVAKQDELAQDNYGLDVNKFKDTASYHAALAQAKQEELKLRAMGLSQDAAHQKVMEGIAQENADTTRGQLSLGQGRLTLERDKYQNPQSGGNASLNGKSLTYQQAAQTKQDNLKEISSLTAALAKTTDPGTRAAYRNEINSRAEQNAEIDRMLPAGQGLAPMPVGMVMNGQGQIVRATVAPAGLGPLPGFGGYRPPPAPAPYKSMAAPRKVKAKSGRTFTYSISR